MASCFSFTCDEVLRSGGMAGAFKTGDRVTVSIMNDNNKEESGFERAPIGSLWEINLCRKGSCNKLLDRLIEEAECLKQTGEGNITVWDKAVTDGNAKLVDHIIREMYDEDTGKFEGHEFGLEELLSRTISNTGITAVTIAAMIGNHEVVKYVKEAIITCNKKRAKEEESKIMVKDTEIYSGLYMDDMSANLEDSSKQGSPEKIRESLEKVDGDKSQGSPDDSGSQKPDPILEKLKELRVLYEDEDKDKADTDPSSDIQKLKESYKRYKDFDLEPGKDDKDFVAGKNGVLFFFHWLCHSDFQLCNTFIEKLIKDLPNADATLQTLFTLQDLKGRTPLHIVLERRCSDEDLQSLLDWGPKEQPDWVNAPDGAGRTPLHRACIADLEDAVKILAKDKRTDLNRRVRPANYEDLALLLNWKSPHKYKEKYEEMEHCTALHLAVLHNREKVVEALLTLKCPRDSDKALDVNARLTREDQDWGDSSDGYMGTPLQLAARMGHPAVLKLLLEDKRIHDLGKLKTIQTDKSFDVKSLQPALHVAAFAGREEAVRTILNDKNYDPRVKNKNKQTALHCAATVRPLVHDMLITQDLLPYGKLETLQNSLKRSKKARPRDYTGNEVACINLLLQAEIDIWNLDGNGNQAYPGTQASDGAIKLWYEKVTSEVADMKSSLNAASNAASLIAALVATASFIGPLQPPLGYESSDGFVYTDRLPIRIYLVCNGFSFYLSVASILLAVIPALPMPKRHIKHEVILNRRCLKIAGLLLLVALASLLLSYASASIAVVPKGWSDRGLVLITLVIGGGICLAVLLFSGIQVTKWARTFLTNKYDKVKESGKGLIKSATLVNKKDNAVKGEVNGGPQVK